MKPGIPCNKCCRHGFTIIEVVVALTTFSLFIAAATSLVMVYQKMITQAKMHYTATNIAKNRLELAQTMDFEDLSDLNEPAAVVDDNGKPKANGYYRRTTVVTSLLTNLTEVAITVAIRNRKTLEFDGISQEVRTMFADYWEP